MAPAARNASSHCVTFKDIQSAADTLRGHIVRTPLLAAPKLSALTGAKVFVKYENLQFTNSFKDRGAYLKLSSLKPGERKRGVIAMSAGNHAQAVAYHASRLDIPAVIVMPVNTPFVKVGNTEALGAEVVLSGETLQDCRATADKIASERTLTLIHPYDDPLVIAGQGTVGLEVLLDEPDIEILVIPVGGGGLIAGSAIAAKALNPDIEIIGVETESYPSMYHAIRGEDGVCGGQTLADGIAVKAAGDLTLPIVRDLVCDIILVDETMIERAVCCLLTIQKSMAEGAGAAAFAALVKQPDRFADKKVALVLSGGNIDPRILASIVVRGLEQEEKIISLRLMISDQPGVLGNITTLLGEAGANILEVSHQRMFLDVPAKGATLDIVIETKDAAHADQVIETLKSTGLNVTRMTGPAASDFGAF